MGKPIKRSTRARKCKCKCHISQSLEMRRRESKNDSIRKAPVQMPRDNGINMRVKIRRK